MATIVDYEQVTEENKEAVREEWLDRLADLINLVEGWVKDLGWATRRISKRMEDSRLGSYRAPALMMQQDLVQIALEPIGRFAPRCDGIVDLYLMPALDDIASLYYESGDWHLHYMFDGPPTVSTIRDAESIPLTKDALMCVLDEMIAHAA
jgi:hypothetical protein